MFNSSKFRARSVTGDQKDYIYIMLLDIRFLGMIGRALNDCK